MSESLTTYRLNDRCLVVISECPIMAEHINCFLRCFEAADSASTVGVMRLVMFQAPGHRVALCCPEVGMAEVASLRYEAWFRFRRLLAHLVINCDEDHYPLHASGVVAESGNAILIVGESRAGKTSVVAALLRRGYRFLCDDYTPIRYDDAMVKSMPLGATVSEQGFQLMPELAGLKRDTCRFYFERQWHWTINFADKYEIVPDTKWLDVSHVFFLTPNFGQASTIAPCRREEASLRLIEGKLRGPRQIGLRSNHQPFPQAETRFPPVRRIAEQARCFTVANGHLEQTADLIVSEVCK